VAFVYRDQIGLADDPLTAEIEIVIGKRASGVQPPADTAAYHLTGSGKRFVERVTSPSVVHGFDSWDDHYHYVVSLQGGFSRDSDRYNQALTILDSLA
jgi:hypothetical protein